MYRSNSFVLLPVLAALMLTTGCSVFESKPDNVQEYLAWLGESENGLTHSITSHGLVIKVTHLPAEYMAYREMHNNNNTSASYRDSLLAMYRYTRAFMIEFAPDKTKGSGDIMYKDVYSHAEYAERVHTMNFSLDEYLVLENAGATHKPSLSFFENTYSLATGRRALVVFAADSEQQLSAGEGMSIVFYDEIYHTGIHRFSFGKNSAITHENHWIYSENYENENVQKYGDRSRRQYSCRALLSTCGLRAYKRADAAGIHKL